MKLLDFTIRESSFKELPFSNKKNDIYFIDAKFGEHFKDLKQVFMYITDRCNIGCEQCIYKPSINHYIKEEIEIDDALALLKTFRELGAKKVTFLGGEPTLYGSTKNHEPLLQLIQKSKEMGFEYIRLDTNGQVLDHLLDKEAFKLLDEIAFSIDGFSSETNDMLRGEGTFKRAVKNLKIALKKGYKITITCCVHKLLLTKENDIYLIEKMIRFAEELGISQINFHDLFKAGVPMDTWTGNFAPTPESWVFMYDEISKKITNNEFNIDVRLPQCFIDKKEFEQKPQYYGYCPVKLGERVMVHPNGIIRICSNLICTGFGTAKYEKRTISWDYTGNNEVAGHDLDNNTPCTNRSRHKKYGHLVPLCFSFKPNQNEYVWKNNLNWDNKKQ